MGFQPINFITPCKFGEGVGYYDNSDITYVFENMYHSMSYANQYMNNINTNCEKIKIDCKKYKCFFKAIVENGIINYPHPKDCYKKSICYDKPKMFIDKLIENNKFDINDDKWKPYIRLHLLDKSRYNEPKNLKTEFNHTKSNYRQRSLFEIHNKRK